MYEVLLEHRECAYKSFRSGKGGGHGKFCRGDEAGLNSEETVMHSINIDWYELKRIVQSI